MTDDIVARLRGAADESIGCNCVKCEAADEIERLRGERDAARAEVCLLRAANTNANEGTTKAMEDYAASRSWFDLFKDEDVEAK
jgi:hypothetical protein